MLRRTAILLSATLRAQSSSPLACDAQPALLAMLHGAQSLPSDVLSPSYGSLYGRAAYLGPTTSSRAYHPSTSAADAKPGAQAGSEETISLTFIDKENQPHTVRAPLGKHLLEVAHDNEIDLEGGLGAFGRKYIGAIVFLIDVVGHGLFSLTLRHNPVHIAPGACEASLACSTCHVIVEVRHTAAFEGLGSAHYCTQQPC